MHCFGIFITSRVEKSLLDMSLNAKIVTGCAIENSRKGVVCLIFQITQNVSKSKIYHTLIVQQFQSTLENRSSTLNNGHFLIFPTENANSTFDNAYFTIFLTIFLTIFERSNAIYQNIKIAHRRQCVHS